MEHDARQDPDDGAAAGEGKPTDAVTPVVTAFESKPGRTIFTEEDNTDAWIATDLTVDDWR